MDNLNQIEKGIFMKLFNRGGHGKPASYKGLEERHAKLAVGSSITLVSFLWDTYEMREKLK